MTQEWAWANRSVFHEFESPDHNTHRITCASGSSQNPVAHNHPASPNQMIDRQELFVRTTCSLSMRMVWATCKLPSRRRLWMS